MIRGVNIHNRSLQNIVDNVTAREVTKIQNAAKLALKESVEAGISKWYRDLLSESSGLAMKESMKYSNGTVKQSGRYIEIEIIANFDSNIYEYYSSHYHIWEWQDRHNANIDPAHFVWDLQWNQGILGLPEYGRYTGWRNPYFQKGSQSMHDCVRDVVSSSFEKNFKKIKL